MRLKLLAWAACLLLAALPASGQITVSTGTTITTVGTHVVDIDLGNVAANEFNAFKFTAVSSDAGVTVPSLDTSGTLSGGMSFPPSSGQLPTPQGGNSASNPINTDGTLVRLTIVVGSGVTNATVTLTAVEFKLGLTERAISPAVPTITISVGANTAPVANADAITVSVAGTGSGNVLTNDTDLDSDPLTASLATAASNGTATVSSNGAFTYTHDGSATTSDSFTYTVSDGNGGSDTGTVSVTVTNQAPTAAAVSATTDFQTATTVTLSATDPESQSLTYSVVSGPSNGTVGAVSGTSVTYTPNSGFSGSDSFTYKANDGLNDSNTATVSITVNAANAAPVANADAATVNLGQSVSGNVLTNDTDPDSDPLTAALGTAATNGTATVSSNGAFTYTHSGNPTTSDSFTYTVSDGNGGSATGTVTITVVNQAPVATNVSASTQAGSAVTVTMAATDSDGQMLTYSIVSTPGNGTLSAVSGATVTYTPNSGYSGSDTFTFRANDGLTNSNTATATVSVNGAPVAGADAATVVVGQSVSGNVLTNDTDPDGDTLTSSLASAPANGTAIVTSGGTFTYTHNGSATTFDSFTYTASDGNGGEATATVAITVSNQAPTALDRSTATPFETAVTITFSATDPESQPLTYSIASLPSSGSLGAVSGASVTYTPATGFSGTDTFTYKANDGLKDSNTATVTVTVEPGNEPPTAVGDAFTVVVAGTVTGNVLSNDTDPDGDALTATLASQPSSGTATLATDGSLSYVHNGSATTSDSFAYTASDGNGGEAIGTVSITITNQAPTALDRTATTEFETAVTVTLSASDPESQTLTYSIVTAPTSGSLGAISGTSVTYTPATGYSGTETFTYKANDGLNDSNTATVTVTVNEQNLAPTAVADAYSGSEDTVLTVAAPGVLTNDSDPNGDAMSVALETSPDNGQLTLQSNGSFTYTPNLNYHGSDAFTYTATDGTLTSSAVTVSLTIASVNDAPVADAKTLDAIAGTPATVTLTGSDIDQDPLTFELLVDARNGTVSISGNVATYTANSGYRGSDDFFYRANDGTTTSEAAAVTITVTGNDPPVAVDDTYEVAEEDVLSVSDPGVLTNDSDPDGDALTITVVSTTQNGTLFMNPGGGFFYEPASDFYGTDTFTYRLNDGMEDSNVATATINVTPTGSARLQIVHNAPDASVDPADIYIDGELFLFSAAYGSASPFVERTDGTVQVAVAPSGSGIGAAVGTFAATLEEDNTYVIVFGGTASSGFALHTVPNAMESAQSDRIEVFFFQGSPDLPTIDVLAVSDDLNNPGEVAVLSGARFGDFSPYLPNSPNQFNFEVRTLGGSTIDVFRLNLSGGAGKAYSVLVGGLLQGSGYPLAMRAYDESGDETVGSVVTSMEPDNDLVPKTFLLRGNYPNPFNPRTNIQFDLPEAAEVAVRVTDLLGREMLSIPAQPFSAGTNLFIPVDATELASGIYIYRVEARAARELHIATGTMTLIK